jgi:hypothetical protein
VKEGLGRGRNGEGSSQYKVTQFCYCVDIYLMSTNMNERKVVLSNGICGNNSKDRGLSDRGVWPPLNGVVSGGPIEPDPQDSKSSTRLAMKSDPPFAKEKRKG